MTFDSDRTLRFRPTKLRSQRDVNLWRIPLQLSLIAVALFGITLIPDILDKYGVIRIPSWLTMGSIDDARAILSAMMGAVATVLALIFSVALLVLSMVATLFGPRLLYRFLQDWGHSVHDRPVHGHVRLHLPGLPCHPSEFRIDLHSPNLAAHELGARRD
jgi:hypothetical protein